MWHWAGVRLRYTGRDAKTQRERGPGQGQREVGWRGLSRIRQWLRAATGKSCLLGQPAAGARRAGGERAAAASGAATVVAGWLADQLLQ